MKLLTILQALALVALAIFGATAGSHAGGQSAGQCPPSEPGVQCDL